MSLLHGEVRPTCSANGQKVAIIGTLTLMILKINIILRSPFNVLHSVLVLCYSVHLKHFLLARASEQGNWRASEASETLSGLFNRELR